MEERQKIVQYKLGNSKSCIKFWAISELLADKDDSTVVVYCIQSRVKTCLPVLGKALTEITKGENNDNQTV